MVDALLGPFYGAEAVYPHRGELGAMDTVPADLTRGQFDAKAQRIEWRDRTGATHALNIFGMGAE